MLRLSAVLSGFIALAGCSISPTEAVITDDPYVGQYIGFEGQYVVDIEICPEDEARYCGVVSGVADAGASEVDVLNYDPMQRGKPLAGMRVLEFGVSDEGVASGRVYLAHSIGRYMPTNIEIQAPGELSVVLCGFGGCEPDIWSAAS